MPRALDAVKVMQADGPELGDGYRQHVAGRVTGPDMAEELPVCLRKGAPLS